MSVNRTIHFHGAVILDVTVIVTAYLYVFSWEERAIDELLPTRVNRRRLWAALVNVVTFDRVRNFDTSRPDPLNALLFVTLHLFARTVSARAGRTRWSPSPTRREWSPAR